MATLCFLLKMHIFGAFSLKASSEEWDVNRGRNLLSGPALAWGSPSCSDLNDEEILQAKYDHRRETSLLGIGYHSWVLLRGAHHTFMVDLWPTDKDNSPSQVVCKTLHGKHPEAIGSAGNHWENVTACFNETSICTLLDVKRFSENYLQAHGTYHFIGRNCQDFAVGLMHGLTGKHFVSQFSDLQLKLKELISWKWALRCGKKLLCVTLSQLLLLLVNLCTGRCIAVKVALRVVPKNILGFTTSIIVYWFISSMFGQFVCCLFLLGYIHGIRTGARLAIIQMSNRFGKLFQAMLYGGWVTGPWHDAALEIRAGERPSVFSFFAHTGVYTKEIGPRKCEPQRFTWLLHYVHKWVEGAHPSEFQAWLENTQKSDSLLSSSAQAPHSAHDHAQIPPQEPAASWFLCGSACEWCAPRGDYSDDHAQADSLLDPELKPHSVCRLEWIYRSSWVAAHALLLYFMWNSGN